MPYKDPQKQKEAQHRAYVNKKRQYLARTSRDRVERRRALAIFVQEIKRKPCADCKIEYPYYVMQFDHVQGKKVGNIGRMVNQAVRLETLEAEIAKCELVCANCHAKRTFKRIPQNGTYGRMVSVL